MEMDPSGDKKTGAVAVCFPVTDEAVSQMTAFFMEGKNPHDQHTLVHLEMNQDHPELTNAILSFGYGFQAVPGEEFSEEMETGFISGFCMGYKLLKIQAGLNNTT